jgi:hypothetical protein
VSTVLVVAVNSTEPRQEVRPALPTDPGLVRLDPEVHHPEIAPTLVGSIGRREGVAIGAAFNPILGPGFEEDYSSASVA